MQRGADDSGASLFCYLIFLRLPVPPAIFVFYQWTIGPAYAMDEWRVLFKTLSIKGCTGRRLHH